DGVFVQRFITDVSSPKGARHFNVVLDHCREGANLYGRTYAVMYDLSGLGGGQMQRVMNDWKNLIDRMEITSDPAYLHHAGKPVVFPGFSWHNMNPGSALDQIPRLKGQFLWKQMVEAKKAGATMIYQAMFDEVNEGTAIFKCSNSPPVGASSFVTYEDLPSDFY